MNISKEKYNSDRMRELFQAHTILYMTAVQSYTIEIGLLDDTIGEQDIINVEQILKIISGLETLLNQIAKQVKEKNIKQEQKKAIAQAFNRIAKQVKNSYI